MLAKAAGLGDFTRERSNIVQEGFCDIVAGFGDERDRHGFRITRHSLQRREKVIHAVTFGAFSPYGDTPIHVALQGLADGNAPQGGILRAIVPLGARVKKNDLLGFIADSLGDNEAPVETPVSGIVIGKLNLPLVSEGEALYHIARFGEPDSAAQAVEQFQIEMGPESDRLPPEDPPIS